MGILGLSKLIADLAPIAVKESEIKHYFGKYFQHNLTRTYKTVYLLLFF